MANNKDNVLSDALKKILSVGMGAAFMTEDALKNTLGDLSVSKEMLSGILQNAKSVKEDVLTFLRDEIHTRLEKVDPKQMLRETLDNYDIEIRAKVKFTKKRPEKK